MLSFFGVLLTIGSAVAFDVNCRNVSVQQAAPILNAVSEFSNLFKLKLIFVWFTAYR